MSLSASLIALGLLATPSPGADTAEEAARALLAASRALHAHAGHLAYEARLRFEGPVAEHYRDIELARVVLGPPEDRAAGALRRPFRIEEVAGRGAPDEVGRGASWDGEELRVRLPDARLVWRGRPDPAGSLPPFAELELLLPGFGPTPAAAAGAAVLRIGDARIGDVPCDLVRIDERLALPRDAAPTTTLEVRLDLALARDDHRVVRATRTVWTRRGEVLREEGRVIVDVLSPLAVVAAPDAQLPLPTPKGWSLVDAEADARLAPPPTDGLPRGAIAPAWTLEDAEGRRHRAAEYRGRPLVVVFFAPWCAPAAPALAAVERATARAGAAAIAACTDASTAAEARAWAAEQQLRLPVVLDAADLAAKFGVTGLPHVFVIDAHGAVAWSSAGYFDGLELAVEAALAAPGGPDSGRVDAPAPGPGRVAPTGRGDEAPGAGGPSRVDPGEVRRGASRTRADRGAGPGQDSSAPFRRSRQSSQMSSRSSSASLVAKSTTVISTPPRAFFFTDSEK